MENGCQRFCEFERENLAIDLPTIFQNSPIFYPTIVFAIRYLIIIMYGILPKGCQNSGGATRATGTQKEAEFKYDHSELSIYYGGGNGGR